MPVSISGDGTFAGLTSVETINVLHPDAVDPNIVLSDDGSVALDSIPASIQSAIDGAGGLVAVKSVVKTDTFTGSAASKTGIDVTNLSITHALSNASNKLILMANFGMASGSGSLFAVGIGIASDGTLFNIADVFSTAPRTTSHGRVSDATTNYLSTWLATQSVYAPGDTSSHTYTVQAINCDASTTRTIYVNRSIRDNGSDDTRGASTFTLMEVKV